MQCFKCGKDIGNGLGLCQECREQRESRRAERDQYDPPSGRIRIRPVAEQTTERAGLAWDNVAINGNYFSAFWRTIFDILVHPRQAFSQMSIAQGYVGPLVLCLITCFLVQLIAAPVQWYLFQWFKELPELYKTLSLSEEAMSIVNATLAKHMLYKQLEGFLEIAILIFIWIPTLHLALISLDANRNGFRATTRFVIYLTAVYPLFFIIPIIGVLIMMVVLSRSCIVGLASLHGISNWRSLFVNMLSTVYCLVLILPLVVLLGIFYFAAQMDTSAEYQDYDDTEVEMVPSESHISDLHSASTQRRATEHAVLLGARSKPGFQFSLRAT